MEAREEQLVPVFIPALGAILVLAEDRKGEPLYGPTLSRERTLIVARNYENFSSRVSLTEF